MKRKADSDFNEFTLYRALKNMSQTLRGDSIAQNMETRNILRLHQTNNLIYE